MSLHGFVVIALYKVQNFFSTHYFVPLYKVQVEVSSPVTKMGKLRSLLLNVYNECCLKILLWTQKLKTNYT